MAPKSYDWDLRFKLIMMGNLSRPKVFVILGWYFQLNCFPTIWMKLNWIVSLFWFWFVYHVLLAQSHQSRSEWIHGLLRDKWLRIWISGFGLSLIKCINEAKVNWDRIHCLYICVTCAESNGNFAYIRTVKSGSFYTSYPDKISVQRTHTI